jgi:hypothetical protein
MTFGNPDATIRKQIIICAMVCSLAGISSSAYAQQQVSISDYLKGVLDSTSLSYSTANLKESQQPATLQYTNNITGKSRSYSIDCTLSSNLLKASWIKWYLGPTFEYHKNTVISQPQDNLQIGVTGDYLLYLKDRNKPEIPARPYLIPQMTLTYVRDEVSVGKNSFFAQIDVSAYHHDVGLNDFYFPFSHSLHKQLGIIWNPDIGIQYQSGNNINKSNNPGSEARIKLGMELDVYPFTVTLDQRLKLLAADTYWRTGFTSGQYSIMKPYFNLFKTGIAYFLDKSNRFSIGLNYSNGQNVETGLPEQKLFTVALQARLKNR